MIIRSAFFYITLIFWTVFMGIICIPYLLLPSNFLSKPTKVWIKGIFILLERICNVTHEIIGLNNLPNEPVIIVSKHQSAFETFALFYYIKNSFFIHKKELYYIPVFGQYLYKSNMVAINRKQKSSAMRKMLNNVKKKLQHGSSIIIFPEGTRKLPGELPDYKPGFIGIYNITKRKIIPIALNSGLFWTKNSWIIKKGHIKIKILPIIPTNLNKDEVYNLVKKNIEEASNKLLI